MKFIQEHKGWKIYGASVKTEKGYPLYVACKCTIIYAGMHACGVKQHCIEGVDLPNLKADIEEAER